MQICPRCESEMNEGESSVEFYDEFSESEFNVELSAVWCDSCNYFKLDAN